jgi:uncharacterized protein with PIN domain
MDDSRDPTCPNCGEQLVALPEGAVFTPIGIPTIEPSKVCATCKVGYWLGPSGWLAVATFDD